MADQQKYIGKLKEERVVVFGGSSGLGYAASEAAVEDGASVIIVSSREASVQSAITKMNSHYPSAVDRITGHTCDLGSNDLEEQILAVFEETGRVDHIVFTAGDDLVMDGIHNISYDRVIQAGQVRFFAPLFVAKVGARYLKQTPRSSITFTGGVIIEKPRPGWTVQASYAAGMLGMHRGLAIDLAPIRVNLFSPGATETEMWKLDQNTEEEAAVIRKSVGQELLTGQIGRPEDFAVCSYRCASMYTC
jgi:NAD(P)-dependent dehydrogenase (short-subunit alcohol dehydrogenase family)